MTKYLLIFLFAGVALNHYAHAAKLTIKNSADYAIMAYPDFEWTTVTVNKRETKVVVDRKDAPLKLLTAFEVASTSSTAKKFRLKDSLVGEFNNFQQLESRGNIEKELVVNFPDDFDVEVSLRMPLWRPSKDSEQ